MGSSINSIPASHDFCRLFSYLNVHFRSLYSKVFGPRSDSSQGSSLTMVHIICFHKNQVFSTFSEFFFRHCPSFFPEEYLNVWLIMFIYYTG